MTALLLAAMVATTTVTIHVETAVGLTDAERHSVTATLAEAINRRTGGTPTIDPVVGGACGDDRCAGAIAGRTGNRDIIYMTLLGVPTRIRLMTERVQGDSGDLLQAQRDLQRDPTTWAPALDAVATMLFPEAVPELVAPAPASPGPWILIGASGTALIGAIIAGVIANGARRQIEREPQTIDERDRLSETTVVAAWTANVLYGLTAAAAGSGVLWLVFD